MQLIDIYRGQDLFCTIKPDDSSNQFKKVMGENQLNITFQANNHLPFQINDHCTVFGEVYVLYHLPIVKKLGTYLYEYTVTLMSQAYELVRTQFLFLGADNTLKESDFSLMGNADTFIKLIVDNLNRINSGWIKGQVNVTDYRNLTFSKNNCYNALGRISEEFDTEFWIEGKTVHLTERQRDTGYTFKHGQNKGLYDITRQNVDNSNVITRLYAFGNQKNLPADYRDYSPRLRMTDGDYFIEKNTSMYGTIEETQIFDDIYPHRTGTVTAVNAGDQFVFVDADIDFDVNDQLLPGVPAKVIFNTGQLSGYEFEISQFNNSTKTFTILKNKNERVIEVPSVALRPAIGDKYILVDINMPASYITAAEVALKARAQEYLDLVCDPQLKYLVTIDPVFMKRRGYSISIGDLVWIVDVQLQIQRRIRVLQVTRNIVNEFAYQVEISDTNEKGTFSGLVSSQSANSRDLSSIRSNISSNSILNNTAIGDLKIQQGSLVIEDAPSTATTTGFSPLYIDDATGKIYKLV